MKITSLIFQISLTNSTDKMYNFINNWEFEILPQQRFAGSAGAIKTMYFDIFIILTHATTLLGFEHKLLFFYVF